MARLVGVDLPRDKRMEIALTYIYGIGRTRSKEILEATGVDVNMRSKDLTDDQLTQLREYIEASLKVEGDLRREVQADIRRKIEIGDVDGRRSGAVEALPLEHAPEAVVDARRACKAQDAFGGEVEAVAHCPERA